MHSAILQFKDSGSLGNLNGLGGYHHPNFDPTNPPVLHLMPRAQQQSPAGLKK